MAQKAKEIKGACYLESALRTAYDAAAIAREQNGPAERAR